MRDPRESYPPIVLDEPQVFVQGRQAECDTIVPASAARPLPAGEPEFGRRARGDTSMFIGPKVPAWAQDPEKWVALSRADRRALERHHRKQLKR